MSIIRVIILSLFIFTQSQANTIYNLIKIPNLEIYEINTSNKLRYLYAKQPFTIGVDNNINCFNSEKKVLDEKYEIIQPCELDGFGVSGALFTRFVFIIFFTTFFLFLEVYYIG